MSVKKAIVIILAALVVAVSAVGILTFLKDNLFNPTDKNIIKQNLNMASEQKIIRPPAVAGAFYPGSKNEIENLINNFFVNVNVEQSTGTPKILIVPHAGYIYSGQVAAYSFKQLQGLGIKRAIIIAPSHHYPVSGLVLSSATHWRTPLSLIKVAEINKDLASENNFEVSDQVHEPEHSIEVEVPFIQVVDPAIEIVPIIVGQLSTSQQTEFAKVLEKYLDSQTILVVSVDLSHYHPYEQALKLDQQSIDDTLKLDSNGVLDDEIDAPWAVSAVLQLAKEKGWQPKLLNYQNSGDVTGDKSGVVGYAAVGFYSQEQKDEYLESEKQELLGVARTTLELYLTEGKVYEPQTDNQKFKEKRGVFVTLNKNGNLRGCIGYIQPVKSLIEAVRDNAISAAVHDSRFEPVDAIELNDIKIEISILTIPKPDILENIIENHYGVVLQQGNNGATYLPQVWDDLSDPDEFFSSLCLKGGMSLDCYKDPKTELMSYRAIGFRE